MDGGRGKNFAGNTHSLNRLQTGENSASSQELVKDVLSHKLALIKNLLEELKK